VTTHPHGYRGRRWEHTRRQALARANNRCQRCGARSTLVIHHRDEQGMEGERAHDPDNLTVLCRSCHGREHGTLPWHD
jgi:5-methylcytosine-specific restriction endonuclease McrA